MFIFPSLFWSGLWPINANISDPYIINYQIFIFLVISKSFLSDFYVSNNFQLLFFIPRVIMLIRFSKIGSLWVSVQIICYYQLFFSSGPFFPMRSSKQVVQNFFSIVSLIKLYLNNKLHKLNQFTWHYNKKFVFLRSLPGSGVEDDNPIPFVGFLSIYII